MASELRSCEFYLSHSPEQVGGIKAAGVVMGQVAYGDPATIEVPANPAFVG